MVPDASIALQVQGRHRGFATHLRMVDRAFWVRCHRLQGLVIGSAVGAPAAAPADVWPTAAPGRYWLSLERRLLAFVAGAFALVAASGTCLAAIGRLRGTLAVAAAVVTCVLFGLTVVSLLRYDDARRRCCIPWRLVFIPLSDIDRLVIRSCLRDVTSAPRARARGSFDLFAAVLIGAGALTAVLPAVLAQRGL